MDVHIYYYNKDSDNLGLIPVIGSCPAEKNLELLTEKLKCFDIFFKNDIISSMSDGANVMQKFARLSPALQQFCYNHGLHLAVIKVFYVKNCNIKQISESDSDSSERGNDSDFDSDTEIIETNNMNLNPEINITIDAIRKISKVFRKSAVKNNILQKYVIEKEKKELMTILDCRTRWNTMETMVERFLRISTPIKKSLIDLNLTNLWNDSYIENAKTILSTLKPLRIAIENLSKEDSTLLTAEGALKFLFKALQNLNTEISRKLLNAVKDEISKRRDKTLISLFRFLQNPDNIAQKESDDFFNMSTRNEIYKLAKNITCRISLQKYSDDEKATISTANQSKIMVIEESAATDEESTLEQQLNLSIRESLKEFQDHNVDRVETIVKELKIFETNGKRSQNLQQLFDALLTIKPTSTQNERHFSIATDFVTKKRTKLGDETLNALCFLKNYFKVRKQQF